MTRTLRSNLPPTTARWATRRALWRALGLTDADMEKPKIAVVNSSSNLAICFSHLDAIALRVKEVIRAAGAIPFEIRTAAPSDFVTIVGKKGGYILSTRDLITNDIEVQVEGAMLDGMLCLASCDKTMPGQVMAAGRLNVPTLVVCCGYQPSGQYRGQHCDIEDLFATAGGLPFGKVTAQQLREMGEVAILGPGVCSGMGTANTMHVACEALGMALPGSTPVLANSPPMWDVVATAGRRIVAMVEEDLKPRDILTPAAFENAVKVMLAVSGSINAVKHLAAIAQESGLDVDVHRLFERHADTVLPLIAVRPNGPTSTEAFEAAGGARGVMKQLAGVLDLSVMTATGRTLGAELADYTVADAEVIRPLDRPMARHPTVVLLRGSLAPEAGIVKLSVTEARVLTQRGPAVVYETAQAAIDGIGAGEVKPGDILVVRGLGPKGTPGMGAATAVVFAVLGAGLAGKIAIVTDGQLSGLANVGITVGEVAPEAAAGGPIGLVENGDLISIDVGRRLAELEVPEAVLAERRARLRNWEGEPEHGWLAIYRRLVQPLRQGAVLLK
jgi:dihydroxy-acid dehydratase